MKIRTTFLFLFIILILILPVGLYAALGGIVPCDGVKVGSECTYNELVRLGINIVDYIIIASIPIAVVGFIIAGFLIMTAGPNPGKVSQGKELIVKIAIGFFFVLAAWLIVNTITAVLFKGEGFSFINSGQESSPANVPTLPRCADLPPITDGPAIPCY